MEIDAALAEHYLNAYRSELEGIPAARASQPFCTGEMAVAAAERVQPLLARDLVRLCAVFVEPPEGHAASVMPRALAFWAAGRALNSIDPEAGGFENQALFEAAREQKATAMSVLRFVAGHDPAVRRLLQEVLPGKGYVDRANDLARLHPELVRFRESIVQRRLMSDDDIDSIGRNASLLLHRESGDAIAAARLLHARAWTAFAWSWDELMAHLRFAFRHEPQVLRDYPPLRQQEG